jgi:hypothetical protein
MDASIANYVDPDADVDDKVPAGGLLAAAAVAANAPAAGNQHADACIASAVEAGEHAFEVDGQLDDELIDDAAMYECEYDDDAELEQAIAESTLEYLADTINTTTTTTTTADNSETDAGHRDKRRRADSPAGTATTTSTATNINSIPNASHNQNDPITEFHTAASGPAVAVTETDGLIAKVTVFTSRTATGWRISTTTEISCTAAGTRTIINNVYSSNTSNTSNADSQNIVYNCSNDTSNSDSLTVLVNETGQPTEQRATTSATSSSAPK